MADPTPSGPRKWLWPLIIALLVLLLLVWLFNPAGNEDTREVEDPIVTPELVEPTEPAVQPLGDAQTNAAETRATGTAEAPPPPAE